MLNPIGSQGYEYNNAIYNNVGAVDKDPTATAINKAAGIGLRNEDNNTKVGKVKSAECLTCKSRKYMDRYVAGGSTTTTIKYNANNPYDKARKTAEGSLLRGNNIDSVA